MISQLSTPVAVTATNRLIQLNLPSSERSRRKLLQNDSDLSEAAVGELETTIRNLLVNDGFNVISVTIISVTANFLVTYDAVLNLPQGTSEAVAQSIVDDALNDITDEEFQDELQTNLIGVDCGTVIDCSDLEDATMTVVS